MLKVENHTVYDEKAMLEDKLKKQNDWIFQLEL